MAHRDIVLTRRAATREQLDALAQGYNGLNAWPCGDADHRARALLSALDSLSLWFIVARRIKFLQTLALTELRQRGLADNASGWKHAIMVTLHNAGKLDTASALAWAFSVAQQAALAADPGDGPGSDVGTCNLDTPMFHLPRVRVAVIEAAAQQAGLTVTEFDRWGRRYFWLNSTTHGQAMRRTMMAEAASEVLRQVEASGILPGFRASMYMQAD